MYVVAWATGSAFKMATIRTRAALFPTTIVSGRLSESMSRFWHTNKMNEAKKLIPFEIDSCGRPRRPAFLHMMAKQNWCNGSAKLKKES